MSYTIFRIERDGDKTVIAYIDDLDELGTVITEDRDKIDYEAGYGFTNNHNNDKVAELPDAVI